MRGLQAAIKEKPNIHTYWGIEPQTKCCCNCKHYRQHYTQDGIEVFAGHCTYPRTKFRKPTDVCLDFHYAEENQCTYKDTPEPADTGAGAGKTH